MWDPRADAWLAGFADGESCFAVRSRRNRDGTIIYSPLFAIWLRADDAPILRALHKVFGGSLSFKGQQSANYGDRRNGKPQFGWQVQSRAELERLVAYFDAFPLRSKKAADFLIWREAVDVYCRQHSSRWARNHEKQAVLEALRNELRDGRRYDDAEELAALERQFDDR